MIYLYPLKLTYSTAHMLWGGRRLIDAWGKKTDRDNLAETWELTVRDDGRMSEILNGDFAGATLGDYIKAVGNAVVSDSWDGARFPLLIKFIDAADSLSVQVHPDDDYARRVENDSGKTEIWYIAEAEPGAEIIYGLADGVTREEFAKAVRAGEYDRVMRRVPVKVGECYFIPSGMLHAIGKGLLIAEIQQNSDLTYRVYDFDRRDKDGNPRQLHIEKALDVVHPFTADEVDAIRFAEGGKGGKRDASVLADSRYFSVRHLKVEKSIALSADARSFHCLLSLGGKAVIGYDGGTVDISRGECVFIPAGMGDYTLTGNAELLLAAL